MYYVFLILWCFSKSSCCVSDLISGWDWAKLLPFSEHIPPFLPLRQWTIKILELGGRQQHFVDTIFLSGYIFCNSFREKFDFVLTLNFWFCFVQLPRVGPIDIALWQEGHWKHPNLHKLISLSQTDFHWEMQKCLARKLWIAELENFHLSVKPHNITLGQIEQCRRDGSKHK